MRDQIRYRCDLCHDTGWITFVARRDATVQKLQSAVACSCEAGEAMAVPRERKGKIFQIARFEEVRWKYGWNPIPLRDGVAADHRRLALKLSKPQTDKRTTA